LEDSILKKAIYTSFIFIFFFAVAGCSDNSVSNPSGEFASLPTESPSQSTFAGVKAGEGEFYIAPQEFIDAFNLQLKIFKDNNLDSLDAKNL